MDDTTRVVPLRRSLAGAALEVLLDALVDGSDWRHLLPDDDERRFVLRRVIGVAVTDSGRHARVAERGGEVVGVAVWQPPGRWPMSRGLQLRALPRMLPVLARLGARAGDVRRAGEAVDAAFPADPVTYLQVLGVAPAVQRRGVGALLLTEGLAAADAAGSDVYLETSAAANVTYYEGHGFHLLGPGRPLHQGGAVMWRLRRTASTPA